MATNFPLSICQRMSSIHSCNDNNIVQIVSEITEAVGGVQIEEPLVDYLSFQTSDSSINIDQFGHVIGIII